MPGTRVVIDDSQINAIPRSEEFRRYQIDLAEALVIPPARAGAPKDTGAGAASIFVDAVLATDQWEARVSWERTRYYMYFHEIGTVHMSARPFLVPALESAARA